MLRNVIRRSDLRNVAVLLMAAAPVLAEDQQSQDARVRAKQPTVITVEGRAHDLEQDRSTRQRTGVASPGRGIGAGLTATGRVFATFGQWLLNVDDDIPSERRQQKIERSRRP